MYLLTKKLGTLSTTRHLLKLSTRGQLNTTKDDSLNAKVPSFKTYPKKSE